MVADLVVEISPPVRGTHVRTGRHAAASYALVAHDIWGQLVSAELR